MVDMPDPKPLTRQELAEFLPNQRAIRAFEKLFDLVPTDFENILFFSQMALNLAQSVALENSSLKKSIDELEVELFKAQSQKNIDHLVKRVEVLEALEG